MSILMLVYFFKTLLSLEIELLLKQFRDLRISDRVSFFGGKTTCEKVFFPFLKLWNCKNAYYQKIPANQGLTSWAPIFMIKIRFRTIVASENTKTDFLTHEMCIAVILMEKISFGWKWHDYTVLLNCFTTTFEQPWHLLANYRLICTLTNHYYYLYRSPSRGCGLRKVCFKIWDHDGISNPWYQLSNWPVMHKT